MMGKVIMSGIVPQLVAPSTYIGDPVFANNDWATIIEACQKNAVPDTWEVGNQKAMTINGTSYTIDIIGKNHDDYADGSGKAPLTFQMHDCYGTQYGMKAYSSFDSSTTKNSGGWKDCTMRNTYLPAILALMPSEVQSGIKQVNKKASAGSKSTSLVTCADKLFLLAEVEIVGLVSITASGEGSQYDYYAAGNSRVKKINGSAVSWYGRSPVASTDSDFFAVADTGSLSSGGVTGTRGVAFAFCF